MECKAQVSRYPGNVHKSFANKDEGEEALASYKAAKSKKHSTIVTPRKQEEKILRGGTRQQVEMKVVVGMNVKDQLLVVLVVTVLVMPYFLCRG
jgi:viroplasmin and RNaseH domain-containing protein